jgi:hypothetical protein
MDMPSVTAEQSMGGALTAEERLLRDTAQEFAQREIARSAIERDEQESPPGSIARNRRRLGR